MNPPKIKPRKRPFDTWIIDDIELVFGLERLDEMPALNDWLSSPIDVSEREREQLLLLQ